MRKGVGVLKASMQEHASYSVEAANSDIGEVTTSSLKMLPVGRGSGQGARHHPSNLLSSNGLPDSGRKVR